ncbi:MAG: TlpA family protein disulfide reductase [Odoribacteraceae bacterium]|jgi:thiol-disulfide isomerase/thioredoxin|nr:TlpA family protein disulfide reductase [Odoribacteraceae bacterium]
MKKIYLPVIALLLLATLALQAREADDPKSWSSGEIAHFKQVRMNTASYSPGENEIVCRQLEVDNEEVKQNIVAPRPGDPSPALNAEDINGKTVTLADFRGKYILIDVWATWCTPCRTEIPALKAMEEKFTGRDIVFVSISVDKNKEAWSNMVKANNMTGHQLWIGQNHKFSIAYAIRGIPRFILIDREGNIIDPYMKIRPSNPALLPLLEGLDGI